MLLFSGEASNVEMGVTNEIFQNEKRLGSIFCVGNQLPEDLTNISRERRWPGWPRMAPLPVRYLRTLRISRFSCASMRRPRNCDFASGLDANNNAL